MPSTPHVISRIVSCSALGAACLSLPACYVDDGYYAGGGYAPAPGSVYRRPAPIYRPVPAPVFGGGYGGSYGGHRGHDHYDDRYGHGSRGSHTSHTTDAHARQVGADDYARGKSKSYSRHDNLYDSHNQDDFKDAYYSGYEAARARDRRR